MLGDIYFSSIVALSKYYNLMLHFDNFLLVIFLEIVCVLNDGGEDEVVEEVLHSPYLL